MNFRTTGILLLLLIAIGTVAVLMSREPVTPTAPAEPAKLINLNEAEVNRIEITAADRQIVLDRKGDRWRLGAPVTAPADSAAVSGLLSSLLSLRSQGQVKLAGNEQTLGMDQPAAIVTLSGKEKTVKLTVGVPTGTGGNVYVRLNSSPQADLVPSSALMYLDKPATAFRDTQLLDLRSTDLRHILLTGADGNVIELAKFDADWRVLRPYEATADPSAVSDVVFALSGMRAQEFAAEDQTDAAAYELDRPVLTVTASSQPPSTQPTTTPAVATTIRFGRFDDVLEKSVFAAVGETGPIVKVPATALRSLKKSPLELRDRKLLDIDPEKVTRIHIAVESPASTQPTPPAVVIERVIREISPEQTAGSTTAPATAPTTAPAEPQPRWKLASGEPANDANVDEFLRELHPLRVSRYVDALQAVATPSSLVITIQTTDESHVVRLNEPTDGGSSQATGVYNGLSFEVGKFVLESAKRAAAH